MKKLDIMIIAPSARNLYQKLANDFSAKEPNIWAGLLANATRKAGFTVVIYDMEIERPNREDFTEIIKEYNPGLILFVVTGQNPTASTAAMAGAVESAEWVKEKDPNKVPASTDKSTSTTDVDVDPSQKDDIVISKETSPAGSEKIMPLDVKAVSKKTEDISKHASYEMVGDEEGSQEAYNAGYSDGLDASGELQEPKSKESLVPIVVAGGSRFHSSTDSLYAGG